MQSDRAVKWARIFEQGVHCTSSRVKPSWDTAATVSKRGMREYESYLIGIHCCAYIDSNIDRRGVNELVGDVSWLYEVEKDRQISERLKVERLGKDYARASSTTVAKPISRLEPLRERILKDSFS